jgi:hypothetical protein
MPVAQAAITTMESIVCLIARTPNPFIPNLVVVVQVNGTVMGIGVWLIIKTLSRLWRKKEAVAQAVGIQMLSIA